MSTSDLTESTVRQKRVRFVCISDTHNQTLRLPKGDVLIHAGDLTNQGTFSEVIYIIYIHNIDFLKHLGTF